MNTILNDLDVWSKAFAEGVVVGLVTPYIIKNYGSVLWADVQKAWTFVTGLFVKTPAPVVATPVVTPVTNV